MAKKIKVKAISKGGYESYRDSYKCSNCGKAATKYFNYCPYCGEKFEEEKENLENQSKIKEYEDKLKYLDKGVVYLIKAKMSEQSPQPVNYSYDEIEEALSQFYEKKIKEYKDKIKNR